MVPGPKNNNNNNTETPHNASQQHLFLDPSCPHLSNSTLMTSSGAEVHYASVSTGAVVVVLVMSNLF